HPPPPSPHPPHPPCPAAQSTLHPPPPPHDVGGGIDLTRRLRAWRDLVEVPVGSTLLARVDGVEPQGFVARLSRFELIEDGEEPVAAIGPIRVLPSETIDAEAVAARLERRREALRAEVKRAERRLANAGFVAKAPVEVVEEERGKLERYRAELADLG
ncbi:MAG: hypothetical protein ACHQCF_05030, partial [Solirubrobacterales bacterium]